MRRSIWTRIMAVLLIVSMLCVPVSAAGWNSRGNNRGGTGSGKGSWGNVWGNWGGFWGGFEEEKPAPTEPETETELVPVEDYSTVENGDLLRASTYALTTADDVSTTPNAASVNAYSAAPTADGDASTTAVKYFPVTMYDYDENTIRNATHKLEVEAGVGSVWNGMYFSGGSPAATTYSPDGDVEITFDENNNALIPNGEYTIYSSGNGKYVTNSLANSDWGTYTLKATSSAADATVWTIEKQSNGSYTIQDPDGKYLNISGRNLADLSNTAVYVNIFKDGNNLVIKKLNAENEYCYLNALGGSGYSFFGGWSTGSPVTFAHAGESVTLEYAAHNFWNKKSGNNANGDLLYTGLVEESMVDDQIVFTVPEAGLFNSDASVKTIYEYVGLPFVFENGKYSFNSDVNGAYFDGTPASGTANEPNNLTFDKGNPQPMPSDLSVGDGSTNAWLPFNGASGYTTSQVNYHFGMRADLPFSMTANGRIKGTDDSSEPIVFTFSGDDDVWVYVDGHLVIDLGGIHNRLDVTINFAENTVVYSEKNSQDTNNETGSFNDPSFATTQKLFTDSEGEGLIKMTRDAFATIEDHEMQFFFLERGAGTSNCRIEFNLPMNDAVMVTKDATKSWSQAAEDADLAKDPNMEDPGVDDLTASEQAVVNTMNFGFTLYKKAAGETDYTAVANTNYYLLDAEGNRLAINSTDGSGHFYLKNGQTAKFITEIPMEGVSYYVVEDTVPDGFVTPDFNFDGEAVYGFDYVNENGQTVHVAQGDLIPEQVIGLDATSNKSYEVTVKGSVEANDSVHFICSNYMNAELPNPSVFANEDIIVIDYGLPVQIDPLANDLFRGDTLEILQISGDNVTLTTTTDDKGVVSATYTAGDALHSGSVELVKGTADASDASRDTLVYTLNKQLTEVEVLNYVVKVSGQEENAGGTTLTQNAYAVGKIYIVPATQMYYEENFADMVTFTGSNWVGTENTSGADAYQEPGVVGTVGDSVYGSDVAYLDDSKDSNGTSYFGDTTNGAIKFSYTFTGTGTTFFARTSDKTGYMRIMVYKGTELTKESLVQQFYRDTYYKDTNNTDEDSDGTLYNIPVYTQDGLDYGTYTVEVTVAKKGTKTGTEGGSGNEFYLDGIRVMQPLNQRNDEITAKALSAYAADGEANMEMVTIRNKLLADNDPESEENWNFVVMTDTDGSIVKASDYKNFGPKEEVYLMPGQSISFAIKYWHKGGYMLNLGMKAPFGGAVAQVGQTTYNLENTVDCYYDITSNTPSIVTVTENGVTYFVATYTITANDSIVALTNLKVSGEYDFHLIESVDENVDVNP